MLCRLVVVAVAVVSLLCCAAAQAATPRCFGAASRDPSRPCTNAKLKLSVVPTPRQAPTITGTACQKLPVEGLVEPCAFGSTLATARTNFLLFGDSHAAQWRPAMTVLAQRLQWRGYQITRNGCSLTAVPQRLPEPYFTQCADWKPQVIAWLGSHPEVTTVFLAQKTPAAEDFVPGLPPSFDQQVAGHVEAWSDLPATVQHVYVIRDNPSMRVSTLPCVSRAVARRRAPGKTCAVPLKTALAPDPAEPAVAQLATSRFKLIDLTPFFCDTRSCYPVVGGVLVYKDVNHITRAFGETLAPYLQRAAGL